MFVIKNLSRKHVSYGVCRASNLELALAVLSSRCSRSREETGIPNRALINLYCAIVQRIEGNLRPVEAYSASGVFAHSITRNLCVSRKKPVVGHAKIY